MEQERKGSFEKVRDFHDRFASPPTTAWMKTRRPGGFFQRHALRMAAKALRRITGNCKRESIDLDSVPLLRIRLATEETAELAEAIARGDKAAVVDAIVDMLYVTIGAGIHLGVGKYLADAFDEVHRSNMTKEPRRSGRRTDGKVRKGRYFSPADIAGVIANIDNAGLSDREFVERWLDRHTITAGAPRPDRPKVECVTRDTPDLVTMTRYSVEYDIPPGEDEGRYVDGGWHDTDSKAFCAFVDRLRRTP